MFSFDAEPNHHILKDFVKLHGPIEDNKNLKVLYDACYRFGSKCTEKVEKAISKFGIENLTQDILNNIYKDALTESTNLNLNQINLVQYTGINGVHCEQLLRYAAHCGHWDFYEKQTSKLN